MNRHLVLEGTELLLLKTARRVALVLRRRVVAALALSAGKYDYFTRHCCNPLAYPPPYAERTADGMSVVSYS